MDENNQTIQGVDFHSGESAKENLRTSNNLAAKENEQDAPQTKVLQEKEQGQVLEEDGPLQGDDPAHRDSSVDEPHGEVQEVEPRRESSVDEPHLHVDQPHQESSFDHPTDSQAHDQRFPPQPVDPKLYQAHAEPSLCVGIFGFKDIPTSVVEERLASFGPLDKVDVITHASSGNPKGYAFVYYKNLEDAKRVVAEHDGKGMLFDGNIRARLDFSKTKGEAPRRFYNASSTGGGSRAFRRPRFNRHDEYRGRRNRSRDRYPRRDSRRGDYRGRFEGHNPRYSRYSDSERGGDLRHHRYDDRGEFPPTRGHDRYEYRRELEYSRDNRSDHRAREPHAYDQDIRYAEDYRDYRDYRHSTMHQHHGHTVEDHTRPEYFESDVQPGDDGHPLRMGGQYQHTTHSHQHPSPRGVGVSEMSASSPRAQRSSRPSSRGRSFDRNQPPDNQQSWPDDIPDTQQPAEPTPSHRRRGRSREPPAYREPRYREYRSGDGHYEQQQQQQSGYRY